MRGYGGVRGFPFLSGVVSVFEITGCAPLKKIVGVLSIETMHSGAFRLSS